MHFVELSLCQCSCLMVILLRMNFTYFFGGKINLLILNKYDRHTHQSD